MIVWELFICAGISWGGCGVADRNEFPNKQDCFEALSAMRFDNFAMGDTRRSAYATCTPKEKKEPEPQP